MSAIQAEHIVDGIARALQAVSHTHPPDFVRALAAAHARESGTAARHAMLQLLVNSKLAHRAKRPVCQDTGVVHVYFTLGMDARITAPGRAATPSLQALADEAVARAYLCPSNPLRASMVRDPLGERANTGDNTPAVVHIDMVEGCTLDVLVVAKGGGGDVKARYGMLNASDSVADWVLAQLPGMGAGWCPPGVLGVGVGGSPEQALHLAKRALFSPIDIDALRTRGAANATERLRLTLMDRINALGIGAQGLGGDTTVLDVKVATAPSHAALLPVALMPNCAATRYTAFTLDGSGPAALEVPDERVWDGIPDALPGQDGMAVDLDTLRREDAARWRAGDLLRLSGTLYTARDAAHKRLVDRLARGEPLPVDLNGRALYYVGPVDPIEGEAVGPAGPTTATRMDKFMETVLSQTGLLLTIGKAERGPAAIEAIKRHGAPYLMATGGAAYLVSQAIKSARVVAFEDLGMEAIYAFDVEDMPVTVAVDASGRSVHEVFRLAVE